MKGVAPMTGPVLVIEHEADGGLGLIAAELAALSVPTQVLRLYLGDRLPDLAEDLGPAGSPGPAGLIVLGGSMGAWDDEVAPWLPATRRLIADAVRLHLPTLGICLGAQLLGAACGGTVERGGNGLELGLVPVTPLPAAAGDPFFGPIGASLRSVEQQPVEQADAAGRIRPARPSWPVHQYHYDAVTRLPDDAELMVTGTRYPHQGFRVGSSAWGVQYHPEVSTGEFQTWVANGQQAGAWTDDDVDAVLGPIRAGGANQQQVAVAHARAFTDLVRRSTFTRGENARSERV
jgi:GMP synthase (glutamine-hydrolysing)